MWPPRRWRRPCSPRSRSRLAGLGEDLVQRCLQPQARAHAVGGHVLEPVGDPHVVEHLIAQLFPDALAMRRQAMQWSIQKRRTVSSGEDRVSPSGTMGWEKQVGLKSMPTPCSSWRRPPRGRTARRCMRSRSTHCPHRIARVQVDALAPGDQGDGLVKVRLELLGRRARPRVVPVVWMPPRAAVRVVKADHVVALPAVDGDGLAGRQGQRPLHVHAEPGVLLLSAVKSVHGDASSLGVPPVGSGLLAPPYHIGPGQTRLFFTLNDVLIFIFFGIMGWVMNMEATLLERLSGITPEERRILAGETGVDRSLYTAGQDPVFRQQRLMRGEDPIEMRTHTRFVEFRCTGIISWR